MNVTVPATDPERAARIVTRGTCATAKVKVAEPGQSLADDLSRVAAVRDALGASGKIRIDVNGAWSVADALAAIPALDRAAGGLEYVEQPVADVADLARVRRKSTVRIAADESIRRASDPLHVKRLNAADVIVVKNQPLGGVRAALAIAAEIGLPVVVSSALESSIGIRAGLAFAAALPELEFACGLATVQLLTADPVADSLLPVAGKSRYVTLCLRICLRPIRSWRPAGSNVWRRCGIIVGLTPRILCIPMLTLGALSERFRFHRPRARVPFSCVWGAYVCLVPWFAVGSACVRVVRRRTCRRGSLTH